MRYVFASALGQVSDGLLASYATLPADSYLRHDRCFRFRAFGEAKVKGETFLWGEDSASFFQSERINGYAGGVERRFAPLPDAARAFAEGLVNSPAARALVADEEFRIGCHQIRITADDEHTGLPAPEGFHQDGYDLVAVTCVATENVSGGISLVRDKDGEEVVVERTMAPGEVLFLADREVVHYVSPITPKIPGQPAHRDVVVITFSLGGEH
ncbi:2OG-Fe dioxygenase family protein [Streptomyces sp. NPDC046685]|uniref:2OG-Fe dioxygenase family protein n=1 Tax=Streptomyces sp. NPDC046685 TaxID=3157202 RepID=UPI0033F54E5B